MDKVIQYTSNMSGVASAVRTNPNSIAGSATAVLDDENQYIQISPETVELVAESVGIES